MPMLSALCFVVACGTARVARAPARSPRSAVQPVVQPAGGHGPGPKPAAVRAVGLRIATFNIRQLGPTKAAKPAIMAQLGRIISAYDLVAVQELRDRHERVPYQLLRAVRAAGGSRFAVLLSPRSGRQADDRHSQEQYAYYYRTDRLTPVGPHGLFDDSAHDYFQREPHVARFSLASACASLVLINIHTRPRAALSEVAAIEHVFERVSRTHGPETHAIALGDFNAGCGYASEADLQALPLHGAQYDWVVPHSADTNVANSQCPYDRIVLRSPLGHALVADWGVDRAFSDPAVSDHFPVWAELRFPVASDCRPRAAGP